jgi:hypothetical protein
MQKTIWALWLQGWENAPDIVRACRASWTLHNPDWTIHFLTAGTVDNFLIASRGLQEMRDRKLPEEVLSDVIRMELLTQHGGVWVDATIYCLRPLDDWIGYATSTGFFAFNRPGPDRMLSNWFIAADKENYIPHVWLTRSYAYWANRIERDQYFWHHNLFAEAYEQDLRFKGIWDDTPKLSADGPHCFVPSRETLFKPVNDFHRLIVETAQYPMLKLTHKLDHSLGTQGTAYRWLCERVPY